MHLTRTQTMRAVVLHKFGGPDVLHTETVPRPAPDAGEVLVRVQAAGVNPVDWKLRQGLLGPSREMPLVPGSDIAGVIEALGPGVQGLRVGEHVFGAIGQGGYAAYAVARVDAIAARPHRADDIQAASLPVAAMTAYQALFDHGGLARGQSVLIHGASGGVGMFAVQLAKWRGARVIGTASGDGVEFARDQGCDEVIDYKKTRFEDVVRDVDLVLDTVGGETNTRSYQVLKRGGTLVSLVEAAHPDLERQYGVHALVFHMESSSGLLCEIARLYDEGILHTVIQRVLPLDEAARAQEISQQGHVHGKLVLRVG